MSASTPLPNGNFNDNRTPRLIGSIMAASVLAGLALVGRLVSRRMLRSKLLVSDYVVMAALGTVWVLSAVIIHAATLGVGKHVQMISTKNVGLILKYIFVAEVFYTITIPLVKISILLFYRAIFIGRRFEILTNVLAALVMAWFVAVLLLNFAQCKPIEGNWELLHDPPAKCISQKKFFIGISVPNIMTDVAILCLPVKKVWQLQMSRKMKFAISHFFLLGGFVVIFSILRFIYLFKIDPEDIPWTYYGVLVWSCVEANIAIVSACLPTMRPLAQRIFPASLISRISSSQKNQDFTADPFRRSSRAERDEEFQRLPDNTPEAITSEFKAHTRCEPAPKTDFDGFELEGLAKPQNRIAVQETFSTY